MTTNYKFQSENEYQLWCQNKINGIYYSNIALNDEKIKEHVQDIARTLHCSEGEQLVKPEPLTYILTWSTGKYEDCYYHTQPFIYAGSMEDLTSAIRTEHEKGLERARVIVGEGMVFDAILLFDDGGEFNQDLKIYHLKEWIEAHV